MHERGSGGISITKAGKTPLGTATTTKPANTHKDVKVKTVNVHIFFDGTGNNIYNSEAHREQRLKHLDRPSERSYTNYYSNIALLYEMMWADDINAFKIYVEGSGTTQYQKDDVAGLGMARGSSGRNARYEYVIKQLYEVKKNIEGGDFSNVILNVYGFSRGAAWARSFCYRIKSSHKDFGRAKINFVGLLDTVSSDDVGHYNDVGDLGLDIGKAQEINYVFHLTAQNDYRYHFPLTPIKGAIKDGIGFECSLPGAHSDIGGGYPETYQEKDKKLTTDYEWDEKYISYEWFIDKGYYTKQQLRQMPVSGRTAQEYGRFMQVYASRTIKFHYQFICFEILKAVAIKKAGYKVRQYSPSSKSEHNSMRNINTYIKQMKSDEVLGKFYKKCHNYIMSNYNKKGGGYKVPLLSNSEMKGIYNVYIHNSLSYDPNDIANQGGSNNKENGDVNKPTRPLVLEGFRK